MAKINNINNKSGELTIDPGSSGDSFLQLDINASGKFRIGVDDDDSDKFKISSGSALGTNDSFVVTAAGEVTKPLTSCFHAYADLQSNVTGDATAYTVVFANEIWDQNSDFDGTSTFTAPTTGKYIFITTMYYGGLGSANTQASLSINTSNRNYGGLSIDMGNAMDSNNEYIGLVTAIADMDASDTAYVKTSVSGGTKIVDILATESRFCGFLAT